MQKASPIDEDFNIIGANMQKANPNNVENFNEKLQHYWKLQRAASY